MKLHILGQLKSVKKEAGFTLLEVLIALTILAIGLLMLVGFQITAIKANGIGYKMSAGAVLTEDALENLKSLATTDAAWSAGTHTATTDPTIISDTTANGVLYTRNYSVVKSGITSTVTMTTQWIDNGSHSVTMTLINYPSN